MDFYKLLIEQAKDLINFHFFLKWNYIKAKNGAASDTKVFELKKKIIR